MSRDTNREFMGCDIKGRAYNGKSEYNLCRRGDIQIVRGILSRPHHDKTEARQEAGTLPGTGGGVVAGALLATEIGVAAKALAIEMGVKAKARYEIIFPWDKCIVTTIVAGPFRDQNIVVTGNGPSATYLSREIAMVAKEVHKSPRSQIAKVTKSVSHELS
ncbi:flavin-containing monooxygenase FMO GS-OX5-like protein [Tanacetum coccineum]